MIKKLFLLFVVILSAGTQEIGAFGAKTITIKTIPEGAGIWLDGQYVGEGTYQVKFDKNNEFYLVTIRKAGYIEKQFRLLKSNPQKTVVYTLHTDEAQDASIGSENGAELANKWMDITCRKELTEDVVWRRLMSICTNYFNNIEVRDKTSGWIKTSWETTPFTDQTVRTRLEIRINFVNEEALSYRARITSEINYDNYSGDNGYETYNRVLKKYQAMIEELQTSVGGGE